MKQLDRRTFLRGLGAVAGLPLLDAMIPGSSLVRAVAGAAAADRPPLRLIFIFTPNGMHMPDWTPGKEGALPRVLPSILKPLAPLRDRFSILSGLTLDGGRAHGDGPGDHARAGGSFLTGAHPKKTGGADIHAGISVDQAAAPVLGRDTRFASLELGTERGRQSGSCDSGYSCAYSSNISWRSPSMPMAKEVRPRALFERLFGDPEAKLSPEEQARRKLYRKSILDGMGDDARALKGKLGPSDRSKVDEYLEGVREVEKRLEHSEKDESPADGLEIPKGTPKDYATHLGLLHDLITVSFQADLTRVVTLMAGNAGSNRPYRDVGVSEGHHNLSHHGKDPKKLASISTINQWHATRLAELLGKLNNTPAEDGKSLLEHTIVVFGSAIGDGNRHNHDDLPVLVAGGGAGLIEGGRHVRFPRETPMCNLYLSILHAAGVRTRAFGDSTGPLPNLRSAKPAKAKAEEKKGDEGEKAKAKTF